MQSSALRSTAPEAPWPATVPCPRPSCRTRKEGCSSNKSGKCALLSIAFRLDERCSELERCEERRALLAAKEFSPIEAIFEPQLSASAPTRHASRNSYLRIADTRNGPVWANIEPVQDPSAVHLAKPHAFFGMQRISTQFKNHPLPCILIGCCFYQHVGSIPREHRRLYAWSFAPPQGIEQSLRREGSYSLAEKRHQDSRMRTLRTYARFPHTVQDEGRTLEWIPSSSNSTRIPACNGLTPCPVCAKKSPQ
jgi:hypothetical protein